MLTNKNSEASRIREIIYSLINAFKKSGVSAERVVMDTSSYSVCVDDFIKFNGNYPEKIAMFGLPIVQVDTHEEILLVKTKGER